MKTIGLIGGLSWESTLIYYRLINQLVAARLGGLHSARILLSSFDFQDIETLQQQGRWDEATACMVSAARTLERGDADLVLICSNTMHRMADDVQRAIAIPLLHIADATANEVRAHGLRRVGLLATAYTMEQDFYRGRLGRAYGLEVLIPGDADRRIVHDVIYDELCRGVVREESRRAYARIMRDLARRGAEGVVLGCTEIMLLVGQDDSPVPVFDTTTIHARAAAAMALAPR